MKVLNSAAVPLERVEDMTGGLGTKFWRKKGSIEINGIGTQLKSLDLFVEKGSFPREPW